MQVSSYLLTALFFYDIYWVFLSPKFFGSNVMVEAATKAADNPAALAADALHLPPGLFTASLELPVKLMIPQDIWDAHNGSPPLMLGLYVVVGCRIITDYIYE